MRSSLLVVPLVACVGLVAACSASGPSEASGVPEPAESPAESPESLGRARSAVINGQVDTTHQAVVAIVLQEGDQGGLCSGTIVKVDAASHVGWVATAAHCVAIPPVFVLQGNDFSTTKDVLRYDILDFEKHPQYNGQVSSPYDFAMIRILGVDASTPVIPLVSAPDGLAVGTNVVSVGYGRTSLLSAGVPGEPNSVRRRVAKVLGQVNTQQVAYDMRNDGICQGDSGGPVLVTGGGGERVAAIHSYVQGDCNGVGVSGRATFAASFLNGQLGKAAPADDCGTCEKIANSGNGKCAAATRACLVDKECGGYYECLSSGKTKAACLVKFPKAEGPFNAAANCTCTQACKAQCKSSFECINTPKCGYKLPAGECATCTEGACCDEALACASDGACYVCLKTTDAAPECATNAARKKLATCVATSCKTPCAGSGLDTGAAPSEEGTPDGTPPGGAPAGTKTTTTSSCAISAWGSASSSTRASGVLVTAGLLLLAATARRARRRRPPSAI